MDIIVMDFPKIEKNSFFGSMECFYFDKKTYVFRENQA